MADYNRNLILKNQNNLFSSLGVKYDEELKRYLFTHKNKKQAGKFFLYLSKELTFQIHQVSLKVLSSEMDQAESRLIR